MIIVSDTNVVPLAGSVAVTVKLVENFGSEHVLYVPYDQNFLTVSVQPGFARIEETVHIAFDFKHSHLIDPDTGTIFGSNEWTLAA